MTKKKFDQLRKQHTQRERMRLQQAEAERQRLEEFRRLKEDVGFIGPFVDEYRRVCLAAKIEHKSLIGIYDCNDDVFYGMTPEAKLAHFGMGHLRRLFFSTTDGLDFQSDPSTVNGVLNEERSRPEGVSVTGYTAVVTDGTARRTVVFMREETGGSDDPESKAALRLTALFHELGHVTDIEQDIHWHEATIDLVNAESFAHHYSCKALVRGMYRLPLGYYLDGIKQMAESDSEYVRLAARAVIDSPQWAEYEAGRSPFYGCSENI